MPDQSAEDAFSFLSQQMVELGYLGQAPAVEDGELQFLPLSRVSVSFQILCGLLLLPFLIVCNTDCCSYNCHGPSMSPITWHSEYPVKGSCLDDRKTCFSNFLKVSIKLCKILSAHFPAVSPPSLAPILVRTSLYVLLLYSGLDEVLGCPLARVTAGTLVWGFKRRHWRRNSRNANIEFDTIDTASHIQNTPISQHNVSSSQKWWRR